MGRRSPIPQALHQDDRKNVGYLQGLETDIDAASSAGETNASDLTALTARVQTLEDAAPTVFVTSDQTLTVSTAIAGIPHGLTLSTAPKVRAFLVCQADELGFAAGELVPVSTNTVDFYSSGTSTHLPLGCTVSVDATNVYISFGLGATSLFTIIRRDTTVYAFITNANWKLRAVVEP